MKYSLHATDKIYPDYVTLQHQSPELQSNSFAVLEAVADEMFKLRHELNYIVVYQNGKLHTILKSPVRTTFN